MAEEEGEGSLCSKSWSDTEPTLRVPRLVNELVLLESRLDSDDDDRLNVQVEMELEFELLELELVWLVFRSCCG